jgi:hypothetical protein
VGSGGNGTFFKKPTVVDAKASLSLDDSDLLIKTARLLSFVLQGSSSRITVGNTPRRDGDGRLHGDGPASKS